MCPRLGRFAWTETARQSAPAPRPPRRVRCYNCIAKIALGVRPSQEFVPGGPAVPAASPGADSESELAG